MKKHRRNNFIEAIPHFCPWCEIPSVNKKEICKTCGRNYSYKNLKGNYKKSSPGDDLPMTKEVLPRRIAKDRRRGKIEGDAEVDKQKPIRPYWYKGGT